VASPDSLADNPDLWAHFARHRDAASRTRLIESYLPLTRTVAATLFARRGGLELEFMDYMQFATLGLIEAIDRFDPALGYAFSTFATPRIRGAVLNNLEALSEQYTQIELRKRMREEWRESLKAPPEKKDGKSRRKRDLFAELADITVGLALGYLLEGSGMLLAEDAENSYRQEFYESVEQKQLQEIVCGVVHALPEQERRVIQYHYFHGLGFTEIASIEGLSKGRISQIHRQALQLIREGYGSLAKLQLNA
jgi:RNA polymerase sigma factor for flagellar operon FliA